MSNEDLSLPKLVRCPWCKHPPTFLFHNKGVEVRCINEECPIMPIGGKFNNKDLYKTGHEIAIAWNSPSTQSQKPKNSSNTNNKKNLRDYKQMRSEKEVRKIMVDMFVPEHIWKKYSDRPYGDLSD